MRKTILLALSAVAIASVSTNYAGDITGKISLKGSAPAEKDLPIANDPFCGKLFAGKPVPTTRFYLADSSGGLADTFVFIKSGLEGKTIPAATGAVHVDQKGCEYLPYVFGLQTGQTLNVKNSDPLMHNVHVTPGAKSGNKESNKAQMAGSKDYEYTFEHPEVFLRFKCDVHPWMFAYAGVVDHPYFAVSAEDGSFKIANVPPGEYVVEAVHRKTHPRGTGITQTVKVGADGAKADFTIEVPAN
jgi:plastocyanin